MRSPTFGVSPGAFVNCDGGNRPPGAVGGRGKPVTWFHGHIVSWKLWPIRAAPGDPAFPSGVKVDVFVTSKRLLSHCHFAQRRSTLAWSMKKSGSVAAVPIDRMAPVKLT